MKIKFLRFAFVLLLMMTAVSTVMSQTSRYITIWDSRESSERPGNSNTTIALNTAGTNYSVYYEKVGVPTVNGTINNINSSIGHPYVLSVPSEGEYRIEAYDGNGKLERLYMSPVEEKKYDNKRLKEVVQYGTTKWAYLNNAFRDAENMEVSASIDKPDLSRTNTLQSMFHGCSKMTYPNPNIGEWDVSNITDMSWLFCKAKRFNQNINNWNVSNVTKMPAMFSEAEVFNQPLNWNVSKVTEMQSMFFKATNFDQDLSRWNVSNVQKMQDMFNSALKFNSDLKDWNVGNVVDMTAMFFNAKAFNRDLSKWNVSNVVSMAGTFQGAEAFTSDLSKWNVGRVTTMKNMFRGCSKFQSNLRQWNVERVRNMSGMFAACIKFNSDLSNWRVGNVENMNEMFNDCTFFNSDLSNWDVSKVTDMGLMFRKALKFNSDISNWNVSLVSNMKEMFFNAVAFNQDLSKWNLSALTDAGDMLSGSNMDCKNYSVTLASWGASTNTPHRPINFGATGRPYSRMGYAGLEELRKKGWQISSPGTYAPYCDGGNADNDFVTVWKTDNQGATTNTEIAFPAIGTNYIIEWTTTADPSNVVGMAIVSNSGINTPYKIRLNTPGSYIVRAFKGLGSLTGFNMGDGSPAAQGVYDPKKLLEVRRWGNNEWTTLDRAFYSAENMDVTALDAPNLSKVTTLKNMFDGCKSLRNINNSINSWNVETITNMSYMFNNAEKFDAQLNNWNVGNVTDMSYMFFEAKSFNSPIASWDTKSVTNMEAMFALTENFNKSINDWNVSNVVNMKRMFNSAIKFNQPLDDWNIKSLRNAEQMLSSCGMDCIYYSLTIIAWADNSDTPSNITLGADNMFYNTQGNTARNYLQNNLHWTIQGDYPDPNCSGSIVNIWVGSISSDWDTDDNWDSGHKPEKLSGQDIVFATAANHGGVPAQQDLHINGEVIVGKLINDNPTYGVVINPLNSMTANRILGSETAEKAGKIQLKSTQAGNGALIVKEQPASKPIFATVQMYSKAKKLPSPTTWIDNIEGSPTKGQTFSSSYQWQYIGIPMVSQQADNTFYKAYMRRYDETYNGDNKRFFQKWHKVKNYDQLEPFVGYEITREQPVVYEMKGQIYIGDKQLTMTRRAAAITTYEGTDHKLKHYGLGHNIFGNSYTASIIIDKMELPDEVDKTIYIYNTGTFSEWAKQKGTLDESQVPGRYMAIPQGVASLIWANRIPSMQGFMLKFKDEETVYNRPDVTVKIKYDGGVIKNVLPQRAPALNNRDRANTTEQPAIAGYVKIGLIGENAQDIMWLIEAANTTDGYDNGFDGENISLQTSASIFAQTPEGKQLQVSSQPSIIDKPFYFRTQNDGKYELILVKNDLNHYHDLQLLDMKTETYTPLSNDTTVYSFSSEGSNGNIEKRFVLVNKATPTNITDGYDNGDLLDVYLLADKKLLVINNMTQTNATMTMSDITGRAIMQRSVPQGFSQIPVDVANGVYIVSMKAGKNTKNVKVIVK